MAYIRRLDLNLLKAFDALLDKRSVTRAAARLSLTQPAVSGMLARLREGFGDPLFVRTRRGIVPTARALELAGPVERVLGEIEALLQPADFEPSEARFTLSLAATDYALRAVVVPFLSADRSRAPGIRVAVRSIDDRVQARLERGELDLALMTPEATPPTCTRGAFCGVTDEVLAKLGRHRRVVLTVTSFLILSEILRTSDLVAVVPRRLVTEREGLALLGPPLEIPGFTKAAARHERTHHDPGHRWLRGLLFETCGTVDPVVSQAEPASGLDGASARLGPV